MRRERFGIGTAVVLALATVASARTPCASDCDDSGQVAVNEVLRCVGIALGSAEPSVCPACDADGDGDVAVPDLVAAVRAVLDGCAPPTPTAVPPTAAPAVCGDRTVQGGETCDDGNTVGGDGCAANCTTEQRRAAAFDPGGTFAAVQSEAVPITLDQLVGTEVLTTGAARVEPARDAAGQVLVAAGAMPVVIRAADLRFAPISIPGTTCACVRGVEAPEFGAGNVGSGTIACPDGVLADVDVALRVDHETTPGAAGNSGSLAGLVDDDECDDCHTVGWLGSRSCACREGRDAACGASHPDACNSPLAFSRTGGPAPAGSALVVLRIAIGLLQDAGACGTGARRPNGTCNFPDYGADCLPCTEDDADRGVPRLVVATTGHAAAAVYDVNHSAGVRIADGATCFQAPCQATADGAPFSCAHLAADPTGGLDGGALAACFPGLDTVPLRDTVTCTRLAAP